MHVTCSYDDAHIESATCHLCIYYDVEPRVWALSPPLLCYSIWTFQNQMTYTIGNRNKKYKQHRKNQEQKLWVEITSIYQKNVTKHCKNGALVASLSQKKMGLLNHQEKHKKHPEIWTWECSAPKAANTSTMGWRSQEKWKLKPGMVEAPGIGSFQNWDGCANN